MSGADRLEAAVRVIFTGSRDWQDEAAVRAALQRCVREAQQRGESLTVIHGGYRGLDTMVDRLARGMGLEPESYEARFAELGRRAGGMRNKAMVDSGADRCVAFPLDCVKPECRRTPVPHDSHGTANCMTLARRAGIPVEVTRLRPDGVLTLFD